MAQNTNPLGTWDDWTQVTNFELETGFLNKINGAESAEHLWKSISNDLAYGLSQLFCEQSLDPDKPQGSRELAPYRSNEEGHESWGGFFEFTKTLPYCYAFVVDWLTWVEAEVGIDAGARDEERGRYRFSPLWMHCQLQLQHTYPMRPELRTTYRIFDRLNSLFTLPADAMKGESEWGFYQKYRPVDYVKSTSKQCSFAAKDYFSFMI